ncbi:MAG TPA: SDR family oxidoreductase [Anaerolineales bacterium]|nr:SDR family oxidoreductase [Anaerolineales bacterium]
MKDKICMVTGATSGIGKATALGLAQMGASVVIVGRDRDRCEAARDEIRAQSRNREVHFLVADLSSQAAVRQVVEDFKQSFPSLHVLVNNAGIAPLKRLVTVDGVESTFAVNYLAPFLLTNHLLEEMKDSAPARVVNVAGDFHRKASIRFDDLMSEKDYNSVWANNQAKLALILFTYELARRLDGSGVTANCLHPGAVATDAPLKDPDLPAFSRLMYRFVRLFFASPEKGAETSIYLASSPAVEGITGKYFIKKSMVTSSPESYNPDIARRLWEVSEGLTGLTVIMGNAGDTA